MNRTMGLAAAAAAATLGAGGMTAAQASSPGGGVGHLSVSLSGGEPVVSVINNTASAFTGMHLFAFKGDSTTALSSLVLPNVLPHTGISYHFTGTRTGGPFQKEPTERAYVAALGSSLVFQVVGNGFYSSRFGDPAGYGPSTLRANGAPGDWLGLLGNKTSKGGYTKAKNTTNLRNVSVANIYGVPEPASMLLLTAGVIGLGAARRRRSST